MALTVALGSGVTAALAPSSQAPSVPRWSAVHEWTVGAGPTGLAFSHILDAVVGPSGTIHVLDNLPPFLRVLDRHGAQVDSFGGRGGGPAEFQAPAAIGWRGDTLWVVDPAQRRVTLMPPDRQPVTVTLRGATPLALLADGAVLAHGHAFGAPGDAGTHLHLGRVTREGALTHAIAVLSMAGLYTQVALGTAARLRTREPFADVPLWQVARDGASVVLVSRPAPRSPASTAFTVERFSPTGGRIFQRSYSYTPRPLDDAVFDREIGRLLDVPMSSRTRSLIRETRADIARQFFRPAFLPPAMGLATGSDGSIWLRGAPTPAADSVIYMVLDASGVAVGNLALPFDATVLTAEGNSVWAVRSADGAPVLVRYRIRRGSRSRSRGEFRR